MKIDSFRKGKYRWLSNFWPAPVTYDGVLYSSVEHAYVASKTLDKRERNKVFLFETPGQVKRFGRRLKIREDWEDVKLDIMEDLVTQKFHDPELRQNLLDTRDAELIEGNNWNDTYWGVCRGVGSNHLGKILMKVRERINKYAD